MSEKRHPAVRLEPADEYLHENTGEPNYNESMYFNFFDADQKLGGFLRIGNRPNERYAETTVCLYLPDGRVVFNFKRAEIADNSKFEAGGMRFEVDVPFERLRIEYAGKACRLADPLAMRDPRAAFQANPFVPVEVWDKPDSVPAVMHNNSTSTVITDGGQGNFPPETTWFYPGVEGIGGSNRDVPLS
jgi:hypothetical protein